MQVYLRDWAVQFYSLPHWDRSCRPNFPSHPVTVYWYWADQSQRWPYNVRCLAGSPLECQFLSHWYDSTPKKSRRKRDSNPGSCALKVDALTTRPTRRFSFADSTKTMHLLLTLLPKHSLDMPSLHTTSQTQSLIKWTICGHYHDNVSSLHNTFQNNLKTDKLTSNIIIRLIWCNHHGKDSKHVLRGLFVCWLLNVPAIG